MLSLNAAVCLICRSTWPVDTRICRYCIADPDAKPRRRRKRDEAILTEFVASCAGIVRLPDPDAAFWAIVGRLAERGPVEIAPAKKLKRSK